MDLINKPDRSDDSDSFDQLSNEQCCEVLERQAMEICYLKAQIKSARSKIKNRMAERQMRSNIQKAERKLNAATFELEDQKDVIKNTIRAMAEEKLKVKSPQYDIIMSILKGHMNDEGGKDHFIKDYKPTEVIKFDMRGYYNTLLDSNANEEVRMMAVNNYLSAQALLIKQIDFQQFSSLNKELHKNNSTSK